MELTEAVRSVREERWGGTRHQEAREAVLSALSRRSEEWEAVVAALGPHAHPGLSPSESVAEVVNLVRVQDEANREMTRLLGEVEAGRDTLREKLEEKGRVFSENLLMQGEEITRLRADHVCTPAFCKVGMDFAPCATCGRRVDLAVAQAVVLTTLQDEREATKARVRTLEAEVRRLTAEGSTSPHTRSASAGTATLKG